jgi:bacterioferritin-associated ferredoxin
MYICICKAVSDKAIRQEIAAGASSMRELRQCLGVGSQCGQCVPAAQQLLARELSRELACASASAPRTETTASTASAVPHRHLHTMIACRTISCDGQAA